MKRSRLIALSALSGATWLLMGGCSSSSGSNGAPSGPNNTAGASLGGSGGSSSQPLGGSSGMGGGGKATLNPLCGVADETGECVPDNPSACLGYLPPNGAGGESSNGGAGGAAGSGAGGNAGAEQGGESTSAAGQTGVPEGGDGAGGQAGAGGEGGGGGHEPPALASYSCQVTSQNNLLTRQCVRAGSGKANAPCFGPADCAPSYACVSDGDAGRCLPYCCDVTTTCAPGTYCAEQPLRKSPSSNASVTPPRVPVCVPADGCSLEDEFPCPAGSTCRCQGDTACMVVRSDGTTACVKPGIGQAGDACPCAWNHVCSSVTNTCVKICRTDASDCGTQKCQASADLPPNFGVCVGPLN